MNMKQILFILLLSLLVTSCKKKDPPPPTGDLLITVKYDGFVEEQVECLIYETYDKFVRYEYLELQYSDEYGQVFFEYLEPGWYFLEAEKIVNSMFIMYAFDSVEVMADKQTNKIVNLYPKK